MELTEDKNNLIEMGYAHRPHGIKGGIVFNLYNHDSSILLKGEGLYLFPKDEKSSLKHEGEFFRIESIHFGTKTICYLEKLKDRSVIEEILPFTIFYPRGKFPITQADEWYVSDLIGLKVFCPEGSEIGWVESTYENGAQTVLRLRIDEETVELPFVENFFPYVDIEQNKIIVIRPDYD